jgi:hypothetical protein
MTLPDKIRGGDGDVSRFPGSIDGEMEKILASAIWLDRFAVWLAI